jgi:hypothetical protein
VHIQRLTLFFLFSYFLTPFFYGYEPTINPSLLEYLSVDDLISIKNNLLSKKDKLSDEDKAWLEQFRKS